MNFALLVTRILSRTFLSISLPIHANTSDMVNIKWWDLQNILSIISNLSCKSCRWCFLWTIKVKIEKKDIDPSEVIHSLRTPLWIIYKIVGDQKCKDLLITCFSKVSTVPLLIFTFQISYYLSIVHANITDYFVVAILNLLSNDQILGSSNPWIVIRGSGIGLIEKSYANHLGIWVSQCRSNISLWW